VLPDFFALGEDNLVVFNLVGHHLKIVAHAKEDYPCSRIGAVTSKAAASVGLLSEIGLVHHHLPHPSLGISRYFARALTLAFAIRGAGLVLYGATYLPPSSNSLDGLARDHAPVPNLESNRISVPAFDEELRLQPSLNHRAVDEVPLDPFAFRAGKRSQVLAQCTRLDRRQLHGRTASGALRTLVLPVEHGVALSSVP
jgi:hypothetical protein